MLRDAATFLDIYGKGECGGCRMSSGRRRRKKSRSPRRKYCLPSEPCACDTLDVLSHQSGNSRKEIRARREILKNPSKPQDHWRTSAYSARIRKTTLCRILVYSTSALVAAVMRRVVLRPVHQIQVSFYLFTFSLVPILYVFRQKPEYGTPDIVMLWAFGPQ